jgi:outer membrane protein assembly factor BamD (BamD/ComL family)
MQPSESHFWGLVLLILFGGASIALFVRALRRSDEPAGLIVRMLATVFIVWIMIRKVAPIVWEGPLGAVVGMHLVAACGIVIAILWRHALGALIARPFVSLYDGGSREPDPHPLYSIAQAKRKRGKYVEAMAEIRRQLARFPQDFDGQLMLAEIQVENLNDLPGAENTIHRLCQQPGHTPRNIALALNFLADWHLKYAQDRDAARQELERIITLYPDSEMAALAAQRIAHLADTAFLLESHDRRRIPVPPGVADVGLLAAGQSPAAPETDPARAVELYVKLLEEHPLDTEVREKLAVLYADHYQRLDLATDQLDQLIENSGQPPRNVVRWLNLLADLQIRHAADYETVRQTVQRIIDRFPETAAAENARNRIDLLKLELKGQQQTQTVKLGTYEQDIGLKRGSPHKF